MQYGGKWTGCFVAEPYQLVDDEELFLFLLVMEMLERQFGAVSANTDLLFSEAFWAAEASVAVREIAQTLTEFMMNGANISLQDTELVFVESVPELFENVRFAAEKHAGELIRGINETTRDKVAALLEQSIVDNWSLDELTEALTGGPFGEVRARLVAVSETTNSYIQGAAYAADELRNAGYQATLIWNTVRDDRVCQICEPRDGQPQGSNWSEEKGAHPGCRCFTTTEVTKI